MAETLGLKKFLICFVEGWSSFSQTIGLVPAWSTCGYIERFQEANIKSMLMEHTKPRLRMTADEIERAVLALTITVATQSILRIAGASHASSLQPFVLIIASQ